jgi:hypothetical protein
LARTPAISSAQRIEVGEIIANFDISGRDANLYIRIYELARTPNIEYG